MVRTSAVRMVAEALYGHKQLTAEQRHRLISSKVLSGLEVSERELDKLVEPLPDGVKQQLIRKLKPTIE